MTTRSSGPERVLERAVQQGEIPGAVALVYRQGAVVMHRALGSAQIQPERRPMRLDTVFDLASLTKPLVTTPIVLALVDRGALALAQRADRYVPELRNRSTGGVTIRQLLTHTSGLPASFHLYTVGRTRTTVWQTFARLPLVANPGTRVEYTCLGFILLGLIAEQVTGKPLDRLARALLLDPLGIDDAGYCPVLPPERYAATECGSSHERARVRDEGLHFEGWREEYVPGAVHDGNAFYALGGVAGNAGLFGTARAVGVLGQMWLNGGEWGGTCIFSPELAAEATRDQTPDAHEARGFGWYLNRPGAGVVSSGTKLSSRAYGHTGFTGTSLWIDPNAALVAVLLTNHIHPAVRDPDGMTALRAAFHDAVSEEAG